MDFYIFTIIYTFSVHVQQLSYFRGLFMSFLLGVSTRQSWNRGFREPSCVENWGKDGCQIWGVRKFWYSGMPPVMTWISTSTLFWGVKWFLKVFVVCSVLVNSEISSVWKQGVGHSMLASKELSTFIMSHTVVGRFEDWFLPPWLRLPLGYPSCANLPRPPGKTLISPW